MNKVDLRTGDGQAANRANLLKLFPECADEATGIDFEKLRDILGLTPPDAERAVERYTFTWPGKRKAQAEATAAITETLAPCKEESVNFDTTQNLYIEGDNLTALKILEKSYMGAIKMIYIDPPYNTGNDFVYRDRFSLSEEERAVAAGEVNEKGDRYEKNDGAGARYHSNWCNMMYPRLRIARNLLSDDGVIFISIDDNEVTNLRKICDEIFGEDNFVAQISVIVKPEGRQYGSFAKTHEYLLVYAKLLEDLAVNEITLANAEFKYADDKGGFNLIGLRNRAVRIFNSSNRPNLRYPFYVDVKNPDKYGFLKVSVKEKDGWVKVLPSVIDGLESVWRWGRDTANEKIDELVATIGKDQEIRVFKKDRELTTLPKTIWHEKEYNSIVGTREVAEFVGKGMFDFPKPVMLLDQICRIGSDKDALVLDFFSGSATTAHAVMQLNAEDGGNRKFIMVQLPEVCGEGTEAAKAGYKNICEIAKERIRRAGKKIKDENATTAPDLDVGFRVLKVVENPLEDVAKTPAETVQQELGLHTIRADASAEALLFHAMAREGIPLSERVEEMTLEGVRVFAVGGGALMAALDKKDKMSEAFLTALADRKPELVVLRDDAFLNDAMRMNAEQIFKQISPDTKKIDVL